MTRIAGVLLLQVLRDAADRAAGTGAGDEVRHRAVGVAPDLRSRRRVVRVGIGGIRVLVGSKRAGRLAGQSFGGRVVRIGVLGRDGRRTDDHLGAVGLEEPDLLGGHLVAHHEDAPVAALGRDDGEADAGVAAGRLDDDAAGLQQSVALGGVDHGERRAVLRTPAGIHRLQLHQDFDAVGRRQSIESHEGCLANEVQQRVRDAHDSTLFGESRATWRRRSPPQISGAVTADRSSGSTPSVRDERAIR